MQRIERLEDQAWIANGNRLINMDTLPPRQRIRAILLFLNLQGTKGAADAVSADVFASAIKTLRIGNLVNITGRELYALARAANGRTVQRGTDIPGSGTTFNVNVCLEIPFRDTMQPGSDDGSLPTELVMGKALEVQFDTATVWGVGTVAITSGTLRSQALLVDETNTPQLNRIFYIDPNSQTVQLDSGVYKQLLLVKTDGTPITIADVAAVDLEVDGKPVFNNLLHEQLVQAWNREASEGAGNLFELTPNAAAFLPLMFGDRSGKSNLSKQPLVVNKGKLQITAGSLLNFRLVVWKAVPKDGDMVKDIASRIGAPSGATSYEPAFAKPSLGKVDRINQNGRIDKKNDALYAYLPGKMRVASTPLSSAVASASPNT